MADLTALLQLTVVSVWEMSDPVGGGGGGGGYDHLCRTWCTRVARRKTVLLFLSGWQDKHGLQNITTSGQLGCDSINN